MKQAKLNELDEKLKKRDFLDEVENDKKVMQNMLSRPDDIQDKKSEEYKDELARTNVLKRLLLTVGGSNTEIKSGRETLAAKDNTLPIASYLAGHAGRFMIEIPPAAEGKEHEFFNWITSGEPKQNEKDYTNVSKKFNGQDAKAEGKIIFNRSAATHAVEVDENNQVTEKKTGVAYEFFNDVIPSFYSERPHWGMNVATGKYGEKNIHGEDIKADGAHGHLYMYYKPPTKDKPGGLLVGLEGTEPQVNGELGEHSLLGAPDKFSAFRGKKWEKGQSAAGGYGDKVAIYNKYSGIKVKLDEKKMENLFNQDLSKVGADIGSKMPSDTVKGLLETSPIHTKETITKNNTLAKNKALREGPKKTSFFSKIKTFFSKLNFFKKENQTVENPKNSDIKTSVTENIEKQTKPQTISQEEIINKNKRVSVEKSTIVGNNFMQDTSTRGTSSLINAASKQQSKQRTY